eukprot:9483750-Pyramimonas_sp.AAC.1
MYSTWLLAGSGTDAAALSCLTSLPSESHSLVKGLTFLEVSVRWRSLRLISTRLSPSALPRYLGPSVTPNIAIRWSSALSKNSHTASSGLSPGVGRGACQTMSWAASSAFSWSSSEMSVDRSNRSGPLKTQTLA